MTLSLLKVLLHFFIPKFYVQAPMYSRTVGTFNILQSRLTRRLELALIAVRSKLYFTGTFKPTRTRLLVRLLCIIDFTGNFWSSIAIEECFSVWTNKLVV